MFEEPLLVDGDTLVFEPDSGWNWSGWNGKCALEATDRGVSIAGNSVATKDDILAMAGRVIGKQYKSMGFDGVPGIAVSANISVETYALALAGEINGVPLVRKASILARFTCTMIPSLNDTKPPIPDPQPTRTGRLTVEKNSQQSATA